MLSNHQIEETDSIQIRQYDPIQFIYRQYQQEILSLYDRPPIKQIQKLSNTTSTNVWNISTRSRISEMECRVIFLVDEQTFSTISFSNLMFSTRHWFQILFVSAVYTPPNNQHSTDIILSLVRFPCFEETFFSVQLSVSAAFFIFLSVSYHMPFIIISIIKFLLSFLGKFSTYIMLQSKITNIMIEVKENYEQKLQATSDYKLFFVSTKSNRLPR